MLSGEASQSVLAPAGVEAATIHHLWSLMLWTSTAVMTVVLGFLLVALVRGVRNRSHATAVVAPDRILAQSVAAAIAATAVILAGLLVASVWTGRAVGSLHASSAVTIAVTGHQWWWEIEYEDGVPSRRVRMANEFHIPVGRPIVLKVTSRDVIHSFWVPSLQGKRDLIPGYTTAIWLQADRPGTFRGQCAEFCGLQHAHMALEIVAEPENAFEAWLDDMRLPARAPPSDRERKGQDVFMAARCPACHTVRGTDAGGQAAPDLTHLATRQTLGAGTLANTAEHLGEWILDSQHAKPGNQMPPNPLPPADVAALVAYLESLK